MTATARFSLPLLHAGQAQKEMFHNEAITLIDALLHPAIVETGVETPPPAPEPGQAWIVGAAPSDDWAGRAGQIAVWTAGGWRFAEPREGMEMWDESLAQSVRYKTDGGWQAGIVAASGIEIDGVQVIGAQANPIPAPSGGATIDGPARAAIDAILQALRTHGLIASAEL